MKINKPNNFAFIDGQNLYLGTAQDKWKVDLRKLRVYLKDKYKVQEAYYFLGFVKEEEQDLYSSIQKAGFVVIFREHNENLKTNKKGNVDTDVVFEIMKNLVDNDEMDKVVIVSGDGDYKKMIDYLIRKNKFLKILFPNMSFASSLYKSLSNQFFSHLESPQIKRKIQYAKKKVP